MEDVVNLLLDVGDWVDISYNWDLKGFMAAMGDNSQYEVVIKVEQPLIEERSGV